MRNPWLCRPGSSFRHGTWPVRPVEHRLTGGLRRAVAVDVGIERGCGQAEALGHLGRIGLGVAHRGHGHGQRGPVHLARTTAHAAPGTRSFEAGLGTLGDKLAFKLSKCRKNPEGEPAIGGGGVDLRPGAGQHFQAHPPHAQVLGRVDQMLEVAPEPVQPPQHERVARLQRLEAGDQAGTCIMPAGGKVLVNAFGLNSSSQQRITLGSERLRTIALRNPDVADEHGRRTTRKEPGQGAS